MRENPIGKAKTRIGPVNKADMGIGENIDVKVSIDRRLQSTVVKLR